MSDLDFDSYIKSVYGSGTAMHLFDRDIREKLKIEGGVADITVESVFGGKVDNV